MKYELLYPSEVEEKLDQGWEIYGFPFSTGTKTYQAVIKKDLPPREKKYEWETFADWVNDPDSSESPLWKDIWEAARK